MQSPRLLRLGESAWTVEFGTTIDADIHSRVQGFCHALQNQSQAWASELEILPSFRSASVYFDAEKIDSEILGAQLLELAKTSEKQVSQGRQIYLPVCFDKEFGPDLEEVAKLSQRTCDEVIDLMTSTVFPVYMIGFLPGFPYMGGLPQALHVPRLTTPRTSVPARSIAIAAGMCAAYPWESPGGWRLLGRTPLSLFDVRHEKQPALLAPSDQVRFCAISRKRYAEIEVESSEPNWDRDFILIAKNWS